MEPIEVCVLAGIILFVLLMPWLLVVAVKDLFRHKDSTGSGGGGIIGAMVEMDRIVNPAGQHVQEAKEVEREEEGIGGE
ncbi:MAG: hypothetical protein ABIK07_23215 [Planctomycetota bacterium]|jgi:hypothetical protein|uniref:hypothetical protein n=1 Tax=uncultured Gimesia sp. TaxID=1678688 RepID=UPI00260B6200|nr:hypothetical protein [uncultured Gimesia sp.]|tara:strand:- start:17917 stop:18153 length:237 start_codon:yes stop_codon:yes gene_type:complete